MAVESSERQILPVNVKPFHYDILLEPDFTTYKIAGSVSIELDVLEDSKSVTVNTLDITVGEIILRCGEDQQSPVKRAQDDEKQCIKLNFEKLIPKGSKATLSLKFEAILNDKGAGFYRSAYTDAKGAKKYIACSQLAPVDARRVFPCFDEPALKSTFDITLISDQNLTCLSNMNVVSEEKEESRRKRVKFATTPPMSTYLCAFVVGDLDYVETTSFRIPIRVYTIPGQASSGEYALGLAAKTLKFYEEAFDSPFPLPKMDMVAIPDSMGAMENWGLVIYMESALLFDEKTSGVEDKKRVATVAQVVQHELAHQWFGNIVTMDWWDGLWLNEGFATWMSWYSTNAFYPQWDTWQQFVTGDLQLALDLDSLRSSHPIEVPVTGVNDINQIFDAISYSKGSCVIRMLATYLGEDVFLSGIQSYLKKHAYGNTETSDLWDSLSTASGKKVAMEMSTWTKKVGYPVLTVVESNSEQKIHVRQDRFLQTGDATEEENETLYPVSLGLTTTSGLQKAIVLETRDMEIPLDDLDFFKLNSNHSGFYRTLYTPERLVKLGKAMNKGLLSVEDRIGLVADASALASSGYQKTSALLGMLANLKDEKNPFVWNQINTCITAIREAFKYEDEGIQGALKKFKRELVAPQARALGWTFSEGEDINRAKHKAEMFDAAGDAGDPIIIEAALKMFNSFADGDRSSIHPNIRHGVYAIALKQKGGKEAYESLLAFSRETKKPDEYEGTMVGLGNTRDPACLQNLLDIVLTDEIKPQDLVLPMKALRADAPGAELLWVWVQKHWEDIEGKLFASLGIFGVVLGVMLLGLGTTKHLEQIEKFFEDRDTSKYDKNLAMVLDTIRAKVAWVQRDREDVKDWLKSNGYYT